MIDLACVMLIAVASTLIGAGLLRACGLRSSHFETHLVLSLCLGFGVIGYYALALGLAGGLSAGSLLGGIAVMGAVAIALHWKAWVETYRTISWSQVTGHSSGSSSPGPRFTFRDPRGGFAIAIGACVSAAVVASLVGALAPPTAGDALCYHLELPKVFLREGVIRYLPDSDNSLYPLLAELLYLVGLAAHGPAVAQLIAWLCGLLLALVAAELARPVLAGRSRYLAGAICLLVPGINNQMSVALNDLTLALFTAASFLAFREWHWTGQLRWAGLTGVMTGLALSTKFLAVVTAILLALAFVVPLVSRRWLASVHMAAGGRLSRLAPVACFVAAAALCGGFWYARSAYHTGNPVYPFFSSAFGGAGKAEALGDAKRPVPRTPLGMVTAGWQATMQPERFGGRGHQWGIVFLAFLPGVVLFRPPRWVTGVGLMALGYYLAWFALRQNVRFLMPALPLLAVVVAWVVVEVRRQVGAAPVVLSTALMAMCLFQAAIPMARAADTVPLALGLESADQYLRRHEPTYAAASFANTQLPAGSRILSQDYRGFYFRCDFVRENLYRRRTAYDRAFRDEALVAYLRADGFTHLLLVEGLSRGAPSFDSTLTRSLGSALDGLRELAGYDFHGADGDDRRYRLMDLSNPPTAGSGEPDRRTAEVGAAEQPRLGGTDH